MTKSYEDAKPRSTAASMCDVVSDVVSAGRHCTKSRFTPAPFDGAEVLFGPPSGGAPQFERGSGKHLSVAVNIVLASRTLRAGQSRQTGLHLRGVSSSLL